MAERLSKERTGLCNVVGVSSILRSVSFLIAQCLHSILDLITLQTVVETSVIYLVIGKWLLKPRSNSHITLKCA